MDNAAEVSEQRGFLIVDLGDERIMIRATTAAPDACRQWREGPGLAVAQLAA